MQVVTVDQRGPVKASLVFAVGARDETYITSGITHVIEHLALDGLPEPVYPTNGSVESRLTQFDFSGPADVVAGSLTLLAQSLRRIAEARFSDAELSKAVKVIRAEGPASAVAPAVAEAAVHAVGMRGAGVVGASQGWLERLTVDEVAAFASTYFVGENATLFCVGRLPETMDLSALPAGRRNKVPATAPTVVDGPREYVSEFPQASLSFRSAGSSTELYDLRTGLLQCLTRRLLRELRATDGLIYGVDADQIQLSAEEDLVTLAFDVRPQNAVRVLKHALKALRQMRDSGPSDGDVEAALAQMEHELEEPEEYVDLGFATAFCGLFGESPSGPRAIASALESRTPSAVRECFAQLERTLMAGLPEEALDEETDPTRGHLAPLRLPRPAERIEGVSFGRSLLGRINREPRSTELIIGDSGLYACLGGDSTLVPWEDIVGVELFDDGDVPESLTIRTAEGFELGFITATFRRGSQAVRMILERVPKRLQVIDEDAP
ncbi:hypothetical protein BJH93_10995 [Kocuria polaris]|nr:hypothetical protein [Kocuria polaris]